MIVGYQCCEKWLNDRRERELSAKDIEHYKNVVTALQEMIHPLCVAEVDAVIDVNGRWPVAGKVTGCIIEIEVNHDHF